MHTKQHRRKQVHKACTIHDRKTAKYGVW